MAACQSRATSGLFLAAWSGRATYDGYSPVDGVAKEKGTEPIDGVYYSIFFNIRPKASKSKSKLFSKKPSAVCCDLASDGIMKMQIWKVQTLSVESTLAYEKCYKSK